MSSKQWVAAFLCLSMIGLTFVLAINWINQRDLIQSDGLILSVTFDERQRVKSKQQVMKAKQDFVKEKSISIVFLGSSRVSELLTPVSIDGMATYNLAVPASNIQNSGEMGHFAVQELNLKHIYIGVDFLGFLSDEIHQNMSRSRSSSFEHKLVNLFGRQTLAFSLNHFFDQIPKVHYNIQSGNRIFTQSNHEYVQEKEVEVLSFYNQLMLQNLPLLDKNVMEQGFYHLDQLIEISNKNQIEVHLFIPPIKNNLLALFKEHGYEESINDWKNQLKQRGNVIDLLRYNDPNTDSLFRDPSHLRQNESTFILKNILPDKTFQHAPLEMKYLTR